MVGVRAGVVGFQDITSWGTGNQPTGNQCPVSRTPIVGVEELHGMVPRIPMVGDQGSHGWVLVDPCRMFRTAMLGGQETNS